MSTTSRLKIGAIIRKYRKQNNYTQEQLAELIDLTPGFLGQVERDETYPKLDNLAKIIQVLGIDANLLFYPEHTLEIDMDITLLDNEIMLRMSKLNRANKEGLLVIIKKLAELQIENTIQKGET